MPSMILRIELTAQGIDTKERMDALTEAMRMAARQWHAAATLICPDNAPPKIELLGEDLIEGTTKIDMGEDQ